MSYFPLTPLGMALLIEVQTRAVDHPDTSILDLLQELIQDRPALPIEMGQALAEKLNGLQMLVHVQDPRTANLFLGLVMPDGQMTLVPNSVSLAKLELALVSPMEDIGAAMGQAMGKQWDRIQAACAAQGAGKGTSGLLDANGISQPLQKRHDGN